MSEYKTSLYRQAVKVRLDLPRCTTVRDMELYIKQAEEYKHLYSLPTTWRMMNFLKNYNHYNRHVEMSNKVRVFCVTISIPVLHKLLEKVCKVAEKDPESKVFRPVVAETCKMPPGALQEQILITENIRKSYRFEIRPKHFAEFVGVWYFIDEKMLSNKSIDGVDIPYDHRHVGGGYVNRDVQYLYNTYSTMDIIAMEALPIDAYLHPNCLVILISILDKIFDKIANTRASTINHNHQVIACINSNPELRAIFHM
jgi:hypothetical protein